MEKDNLSIGFEDVKNEVNRLLNTFKANIGNIGVLKVLTANEWLIEASKKPIPKMLFGEFWFENEICILFADTNLGKSILAVQIGDSISKGENIFDLKFEAKKQPVLYCDFELSDKQFENRCSEEYEWHYKFNDNFIRIELDADDVIIDDKEFEKKIINSIELAIIKTGSKVLIIDNLTFLISDTEKAKDAAPFMRSLKDLKKKHNLSLLILAHTPKRNLTLPITKNDLIGSKMLMNFCDSSFAIGEDYNDNKLKYLKQIKARNTEFIYGADHVIICQIIKPHNFLHFEFIGYSVEKRHLKKKSDKDMDQRLERIGELHSQGWSQREIAKELYVALGTVNKYVKIIKENQANEEEE